MPPAVSASGCVTKQARCPGQKTLGSSGGFTLLELVISFAIIALIVLIIAAAMRLAYQSVEAGEKTANFLERVRGAVSVITAQVQSQIPLTHTEDAEKTFYFEGERERMTLATNYSIWGREKGYALVTYRIESDADGKKTMIATENTIGVDSPRETTLLTGCDSLYFEYFYKGPTAEKGSWVEEWTDKTSVPEKIFLHLILGKRDLSMIIPMRTASAARSEKPAAPAAVPLSMGGKTP